MGHHINKSDQYSTTATANKLQLPTLDQYFINALIQQLQSNRYFMNLVPQLIMNAMRMQINNCVILQLCIQMNYLTDLFKYKKSI
jgi:hypothetical protein